MAFSKSTCSKLCPSLLTDSQKGGGMQFIHFKLRTEGWKNSDIQVIYITDQKNGVFQVMNFIRKMVNQILYPLYSPKA